MRIITSLLTLAILTACGDDRHKAESRDLHRGKRARAKEGARDFGDNAEHAGRKVGGKLQRFFTGRDTISR